MMSNTHKHFISALATLLLFLLLLLLPCPPPSFVSIKSRRVLNGRCSFLVGHSNKSQFRRDLRGQAQALRVPAMRVWKTKDFNNKIREELREKRA